jgi:hypothetical protein
MKYVVEIENPNGKTATKKYEATSIREVAHLVRNELRDYPGFHLVNVSAVPRRSAEAAW